MNQVPTGLEIQLAASGLRRDEAARRALVSRPTRLISAIVSVACAFLVQVLAQFWQGLPAYAGLAIAVLAGIAILLSFEVYILKRRVDAIVRLLRLPGA